MTPFEEATNETWTPRGGLRECAFWVNYFSADPFDSLPAAMSGVGYPPHQMFWLPDARAAEKLWTPATGCGGWEWLVFYLLRSTYFYGAEAGAARKAELIRKVRRIGLEERRAFVAALLLGAPAEPTPGKLPIDSETRAWDCLRALETLVDVMTKRMRRRARKTGT